MPIRVRMLIGLTAMVWGVGIAFGTVSSIRYETTPGEVDAGVRRWPTDSECRLSSKRPTLVMFVHPRCGCSRASMTELSLLMAHCPDRVEAHVFFLQPRSLPADWSQTDLWGLAMRIPGVSAHQDFDGVEHRRFNARISGEVFLYQPDGELSFHGGITPGRGHAGDNRGRAAIESLLLNRKSLFGTTPVFGCELESQATVPEKCNVRDEEVATHGLPGVTASWSGGTRPTSPKPSSPEGRSL